jgi:acyl-CoA thioester hydrolase
MNSFVLPLSLRWADIDANRHLRHSVYYDFAAAMRMNILISQGLTSARMEEMQIGPILFREEAVFKREILLEDKLTIDAQLTRSTEDFGRFSIRHQIKKEDGTVAALITVDIAWIDLQKRKLTVPSAEVRHIFEAWPKAPDFEWIVPAKKV